MIYYRDNGWMMPFQVVYDHDVVEFNSITVIPTLTHDLSTRHNAILYKTQILGQDSRLLLALFNQFSCESARFLSDRIGLEVSRRCSCGTGSIYPSCSVLSNLLFVCLFLCLFVLFSSSLHLILLIDRFLLDIYI